MTTSLMVYRVCLRHDDFAIGGRLDCPRSLPWKRNALASSANQEHMHKCVLFLLVRSALEFWQVRYGSA